MISYGHKRNCKLKPIYAQAATSSCKEPLNIAGRTAFRSSSACSEAETNLDERLSTAEYLIKCIREKLEELRISDGENSLTWEKGRTASSMVSRSVDVAQASNLAQPAHHALSWPPRAELSCWILFAWLFSTYSRG